MPQHSCGAFLLCRTNQIPHGSAAKQQGCTIHASIAAWLVTCKKRWQISALDICHLLLLFFYTFIHTTASKADIRSRSVHLKRGNAYLLFFCSQITLSHPLYNRRAVHAANYFLLTVTQVITCVFAASRQLQNHLQYPLC